MPSTTPTTPVIPARHPGLEPLGHLRSGDSITLSGRAIKLTADALKPSLRWISNHDSGLKHVACDLRGLRDVVVDGGGARLVVHGRVLPFWLEDCERVTLRNFVIDWDRPFVSHGEIVEAGPDWAAIRIDPALFPHHVEAGRIVFTGDRYRSDELHNLLAFDPATGAPAVGARDQYHAIGRSIVERRGDLVVWRGPKWNGTVEPGQLMTFQHDKRDCPAITLTRCKDIRLQDITIHHAGGMGVIAQRCDGVTLDRISVCVEPGSGRVVSTFNDATHFVNCRGHIALADCRFESQLDDAANIHGAYLRIDTASGNVARVSLGHPQQAGLPFAEVGDRLLLRDRATLRGLREYIVEAIVVIDGNTLDLTLDAPLPLTSGKLAGHVFSNTSWEADATIERCLIQKNRARGVLLSTAGRLVVRDNTFRTLGAAIKVAGGCDGWYEAGPVRDLLIEHNRFEGCYHDTWGRAVIDILPDGLPAHTFMPTDASPQPVHTNVRILGNTFTAGSSKLIHLGSVRGVTVRDNHYSPEKEGRTQPEVRIEHDCDEVDLQGNSWQ